MKIQRLLAAVAIMLVFLNFSCTTETTSEADEIYGLDKVEVTNENT